MNCTTATAASVRPAEAGVDDPSVTVAVAVAAGTVAAAVAMVVVAVEGGAGTVLPRAGTWSSF